MSSGAVTQQADVEPALTQTGAIVRTMLDLGSGLRRKQARIPPGCCLAGPASGGGELWFVIAGTGVLETGAPPGLPLRADQGLWAPPGLTYRARALAAALLLDVVSLPADAVSGPDIVLTSNFADQPVEVTGDRQFRVLFGPKAGTGFAPATQFVGEIPPSRAPDHSHPYDETVLVLEGTGKVHIDGASHPLVTGTCTYLPPGLPHCLENTGQDILRVLGVFHPADSPAAKLGQAHG